MTGAPENPFTLAKKMPDDANSWKQMKVEKSSPKTASGYSTCLHETQTIETPETKTVLPAIIEEKPTLGEAKTAVAEETATIEDQNETRVKVWLRSLGKYPTDVANF